MARKKKYNGVTIHSSTGDPVSGWPALTEVDPEVFRDHPESRDKTIVRVAILGSHPPTLVSATLRRLADAVERHGPTLLMPHRGGVIRDDGRLAFCDEDGRLVDAEGHLAGTDAG